MRTKHSLLGYRTRGRASIVDRTESCNSMKIARSAFGSSSLSFETARNSSTIEKGKLRPIPSV